MRRRPTDRVRLRVRQHGVVLARPLLRAVLLGSAGGFFALQGFPLAVLGAAVVGLAALVFLRAVWRWERTLVVVTAHELMVVRGSFRRRAAVVPLDRVDVVEVEQTLLGRLLGYGTLVAGGLEVPHVAHPRELSRLVA